MSVTYKDSGVDLDAAESAKKRLKGLVAATRNRFTLSQVGSFGGLFAVPPGFSAPVLVSSVDGVGTKLKLAFGTGRHDTVGQDLVNHCVNDILVQGAKPLFFMDYMASGEMDELIVSQVVSGVAVACRENGCALLGGETAQMPDFYAVGEYDLAGFVVGVVDRDRIIDGRKVLSGDCLIALPSTGLHTNGYTLARKIVFEVMGLRVDDSFPESLQSVGEVFLTVHRSYLGAVQPLLHDVRVRALAHITGGGIPGNLPRVLPHGLGAQIDRTSWDVPSVFRVLQEAGDVTTHEMDRVFNLGVGMIVVVTPEAKDAILKDLWDRGEDAWLLGQVVEGSGVTYV